MIPVLRGARWVVLRRDWPVRWAHHPLCGRYGHETWRVGHMYLCRGCLSLAAGLFGATVAVWTLGASWCLWALALLVLPVLILSWPARYRSLPRVLRDLLRVALGVLIVATTAVLASWPLYAAPLLPLALLAWWRFRRARTLVQAGRCTGCPELGRGICSGYQVHAQISRSISAELEARLVAALTSQASPARKSPGL